jgi:hypothetical protein
MMKSGKPERGPDGEPPDRAQRNVTDPDGRIQPVRTSAVMQGYNGQIAVDGAHQVIAAQRLQTSLADAGALLPLIGDRAARHHTFQKRFKGIVAAEVFLPVKIPIFATLLCTLALRSRYRRYLFSSYILQGDCAPLRLF